VIVLTPLYQLVKATNVRISNKGQLTNYTQYNKVYTRNHVRVDSLILSLSTKATHVFVRMAALCIIIHFNVLLLNMSFVFTLVMFLLVISFFPRIYHHWYIAGRDLSMMTL